MSAETINAEPARQSIAIVLHPRMPTWQAVNVAAFLSSGLAADGKDILGEPYEDGAANVYCRLFRQPVMVFQAPSEDLRQLVCQGNQAGVLMSLFSSAMMKTNNDLDNRGTIQGVAPEDLDLLGVAILGPRPSVSKLIKGLARHE
jgi:hypothetical protein